MKARREAGVMDHRAADTAARVVLAPARPDPRRRSCGSPSSRGRGSRPRLRPSPGRDPRTGPARAPRSASPRGQPLREDAAAGAAAHDHQVDLVLVAVPAHPLQAWNAATMGVEQQARIVLLGTTAPFNQVRLTEDLRASVSGPGSRSNASAPSQLSRWPAPGARNRADRRDRRSRSRSRPRGARRTRSTRSASRLSRPARRKAPPGAAAQLAFRERVTQLQALRGSQSGKLRLTAGARGLVESPGHQPPGLAVARACRRTGSRRGGPRRASRQ